MLVITESIPFAIRKPKFSDEMLEAMAEADEITKSPDKYKSYHNLSEILEDINIKTKQRNERKNGK